MTLTSSLPCSLPLPLVVLLCGVQLCLANDPASPTEDTGQAARLAELDAYWAEVSRAVGEGDFEAYQATCHEEGVLVLGITQTTSPLAAALARWKADFVATKAGRIEASVAFRFSARIGDESTAHETGIFVYSTVNDQGESKRDYIHFEALLVKRPAGWKILMEYQKSRATRQEWEALESG